MFEREEIAAIAEVDTDKTADLQPFEKALYGIAEETANSTGYNFDPKDPLAIVRKVVAEEGFKLVRDERDPRLSLEFMIRLFGKSDASALREILKQYRDLPAMDAIDPENDPTGILDDADDTTGPADEG